MKPIQVFAVLWYVGVAAYTVITGDIYMAVGVLIGRAISVIILEEY